MKFFDIIHNSIIDDKYDYDKSLKKIFIPYCEFDNDFQCDQKGIISIDFNLNNPVKYVNIVFLVEEFSAGVFDTPGYTVSLVFDECKFSTFDYHNIFISVFECNIPIFDENGSFNCPFLDNILYYPVKLLFEEIKYNRQNLEDLFTILSNSVEHYKTYLEIDDDYGKKLFLESLKLF